jgi:hypothetical protein
MLTRATLARISDERSKREVRCIAWGYGFHFGLIVLFAVFDVEMKRWLARVLELELGYWGIVLVFLPPVVALSLVAWGRRRAPRCARCQSMLDGGSFNNGNCSHCGIRVLSDVPSDNALPFAPAISVDDFVEAAKRRSAALLTRILTAVAALLLPWMVLLALCHAGLGPAPRSAMAFVAFIAPIAIFLSLLVVWVDRVGRDDLRLRCPHCNEFLVDSPFDQRRVITTRRCSECGECILHPPHQSDPQNTIPC